MTYKREPTYEARTLSSLSALSKLAYSAQAKTGSVADNPKLRKTSISYAHVYKDVLRRSAPSLPDRLAVRNSLEGFKREGWVESEGKGHGLKWSLTNLGEQQISHCHQPVLSGYDSDSSSDCSFGPSSVLKMEEDPEEVACVALLSNNLVPQKKLPAPLASNDALLERRKNLQKRYLSPHQGSQTIKDRRKSAPVVVGSQGLRGKDLERRRSSVAPRSSAAATAKKAVMRRKSAPAAAAITSNTTVSKSTARRKSSGPKVSITRPPPSKSQEPPRNVTLKRGSQPQAPAARKRARIASFSTLSSDENEDASTSEEADHVAELRAQLLRLQSENSQLKEQRQHGTDSSRRAEPEYAANPRGSGDGDDREVSDFLQVRPAINRPGLSRTGSGLLSPETEGDLDSLASGEDQREGMRSSENVNAASGSGGSVSGEDFQDVPFDATDAGVVDEYDSSGLFGPDPTLAGIDYSFLSGAGPSFQSQLQPLKASSEGQAPHSPAATVKEGRSPESRSLLDRIGGDFESLGFPSSGISSEIAGFRIQAASPHRRKGAVLIGSPSRSPSPSRGLSNGASNNTLKLTKSALEFVLDSSTPGAWRTVCEDLQDRNTEVAVMLDRLAVIAGEAKKVQGLEDALNVEKERVGALETKENESATRMDEMKVDIEELNMNVEYLEEELSSANAGHHNARLEIARMVADKTQADQRFQQLIKEAVVATANAQEVETALVETRSEVSTLQRQLGQAAAAQAQLHRTNDQLAEDLLNARQEVISAKEYASTQQTRLEMLDQENVQLNQKTVDLAAEVVTKNAAIAGLQSQLRTAQSDIAQAAIMRQAVEEQVSRANIALKETQASLLSSEVFKTGVQQALNDMNAALNEAGSSLAMSSGKIAALENKLEDAMGKIDTLEAALMIKTSELVEANRSMDEQHAEAEESAAMVVQLRKKLHKALLKREQANHLRDGLKGQLELVQQALKAANSEVKTTNTQLDQVNLELGTSKISLSNAQETIRHLETKVGEHEQTLRSTASEKGRLEKELEAARKTTIAYEHQTQRLKELERLMAPVARHLKEISLAEAEFRHKTSPEEALS